MNTVAFTPSAPLHCGSSWPRAIGFRLAAIVLGLMPLLALEGMCRIAGWGLPQRFDDPFIGFSATRPLFALSDDGTRFEIAANRLTHFQPDSFAAHKPANEFRIFCLGGSTVQGRPYSIETSFTSWLELSLRAADPSRSWRVVNCGGVSYATYRLVPILEEVLEYDPDLVIFYEGHNEFLEDRTYAPIKHAPPWFTWLHEQVALWRTYNLVRSVVRSSQVKRSTLPPAILGPEVDARLDWRGGLEQYHRDPEWQRDCIEHFEFNLRRAVAIARAKNIPLLLVNPASNLDWPPFKAEHRAGLSVEQREQVEQLWNEARAFYRTDRQQAVRLLEKATAIDDQHAGLQFDLGKCYLNAGDLERGRAALIRAKDLDICPLRIVGPMNQTVLRVAQETGVMFVDADQLFSSHSPGGINGPQWFVDHVHPKIEGHQLLADSIADELVRNGFVTPFAEWVDERRRLYRQRLDSLPANYYPEGQRRLIREQGWAHGAVQRDRPYHTIDPPP